MGRTFIAANLVTSGFLEACDGASIHRCQPGTSGFLEAFDGVSCQPGTSVFKKHPMGPAHFAANLATWGQASLAEASGEARPGTWIIWRHCGLRADRDSATP